MPRRKRNGRAEHLPKCACGCGNPILGDSRRRYYNEAHKMRAYRRRRKEGKVKLRKRSSSAKSTDPADQEVEEIYKHVLRRALEEGELLQCTRCGKLYDVTSSSDPDYCPSCSSLVSSK